MAYKRHQCMSMRFTHQRCSTEFQGSTKPLAQWPHSYVETQTIYLFVKRLLRLLMAAVVMSLTVKLMRSLSTSGIRSFIDVIQLSRKGYRTQSALSFVTAQVTVIVRWFVSAHCLGRSVIRRGLRFSVNVGATIAMSTLRCSGRTAHGNPWTQLPNKPLPVGKHEGMLRHMRFLRMTLAPCSLWGRGSYCGGC